MKGGSHLRFTYVINLELTKYLPIVDNLTKSEIIDNMFVFSVLKQTW